MSNIFVFFIVTIGNNLMFKSMLLKWKPFSLLSIVCFRSDICICRWLNLQSSLLHSVYLVVTSAVISFLGSIKQCLRWEMYISGYSYFSGRCLWTDSIYTYTHTQMCTSIHMHAFPSATALQKRWLIAHTNLIALSTSQERLWVRE